MGNDIYCRQRKKQTEKTDRQGKNSILPIYRYGGI